MFPPKEKRCWFISYQLEHVNPLNTKNLTLVYCRNLTEVWERSWQMMTGSCSHSSWLILAMSTIGNHNQKSQLKHSAVLKCLHSTEHWILNCLFLSRQNVNCSVRDFVLPPLFGVAFLQELWGFRTFVLSPFFIISSGKMWREELLRGNSSSENIFSFSEWMQWMQVSIFSWFTPNPYLNISFQVSSPSFEEETIKSCL